MKTTVTVKTVYHCSLEDAFLYPMLGELTKIHTGFFVMPRVTHTSDDKTWGRPGGKRTVHFAKTLFSPNGGTACDTVVERTENSLWRIEVDQFSFFVFGFTKFAGSWQTTRLAPGQVKIVYRYVMHSKWPLLYPLHWLVTKFFWRLYMKQVLGNIRQMIKNRTGLVGDHAGGR